MAALYVCYLAFLGVVAVGVLEWVLRVRYGRIEEPFEPKGYHRESAAPADRLPHEFFVERVRQPRLRFEATHSLYGCRHPGPLEAVRLDQGNLRTLFLGDSFTHGWGVADDQTFGAVYGRLTHTTERNLVCGGYGRGTRYHVDQLRRVLRGEPRLDLVFYQIFGNDLTSDFSAKRPPPGATRRRGLLDHLPMVKNYVLRSGLNLYRRWTGARRDYWSRREHVYTQYGPVVREEILSDSDRKLRRSHLKLFRESIAELMEIARARHIRVVAFVIPYALRFEPDFDESDYVDLTGQVDDASYRAYVDGVRSVVVDLDGEYVDLEPAFRAAYAADPEGTLYIPADLHLNARGHRVVAEALQSYLSSDRGAQRASASH